MGSILQGVLLCALASMVDGRTGVAVTATDILRTNGLTTTETVILYESVGTDNIQVTSTSTITFHSAHATLRSSPTVGTSGARSTSPLGSSAAPSQTHTPGSVQSSSESLSTGAKAGIGVGVGIVAVLALIILLLLYRKRQARRSRPEQVREIAIAEKGEAQSGKGLTLPTWKSELSGDTSRAELDAGAWKTRAELEAAAVENVDGKQASTAAQANTISEHANSTEGEAAELPKPPPIPYDSKPRTA